MPDQHPQNSKPVKALNLLNRFPTILSRILLPAGGPGQHSIFSWPDNIKPKNPSPINMLLSIRNRLLNPTIWQTELIIRQKGARRHPLPATDGKTKIQAAKRTMSWFFLHSLFLTFPSLKQPKPLWSDSRAVQTIPSGKPAFTSYQIYKNSHESSQTQQPDHA